MANLGNLNPNNCIDANSKWRSPVIFGSIKCKLTSIIRHPQNIVKLEHYARIMHQLSVHTLMFLKLLYQHRFDYNIEHNIDERITESIPLDASLVINIAKTIGVPTNIGQGRTSPQTKDLRARLLDFYNEHYRQTISPYEIRPPCTHLHTAIDYMAEQVITMYENNVKQHFHKYVTKYVDCFRNKKIEFDHINNNNNLNNEQKNGAKILFKNITKAIVTDIFCTRMIHDNNGQLIYDYRSGQDPDMLNMMKRTALPNKVFYNNCIKDDMERSPSDYIHGMMVMMRLLEHRGYKQLNLFPLRSTDIPGHFTMDTSTMIDLLYPIKDDTRIIDAYYEYVMRRTNGTSKADASLNGYIKNNEDLLWNIFFKTEINGIFHGYRELDNPNQQDPFVDDHDKSFHRMIKTNGVAASIILVRKGSAVKKPKNPKFKFVEPYVDEISPAQRAQLQTKPVFVAIDPNMRDLLYAVSINKDEYNHAEQNHDHDAKVQVMKQKKCWRLTQDKRRRRMRTNKNRKRLQKEKKLTLDTTGMSIQTRETRLSRFCKKTLSFDAFQQYCYHKNHTSYYVSPFYQHKKHRNRQFKQYVSKQKLDSEMVSEFRKKFGPPTTTVVYMGNWSESTHRRFHEPVKGKGFRDLFRKAGYQLLLVKEHKTSQMCSECQEDGATCISFREVKNPRPKMRQRFPRVICHGLVRCSNCRRLWNRDPNAACNIWVAANAAVNNNQRPQYLAWAQNDEMDIDD